MTLDDIFGARSTQPVPTRKTEFPRVPVGAREYMDEMLRGVRILYDNSEWFPDGVAVKRWRAQARELFNLQGYYRPGFLVWAVPFGNQQFKQQGKVMDWTGPMSFVYLWDRYPGFVDGKYGKREDGTNKSFDELMDIAMRGE